MTQHEDQTAPIAGDYEGALHCEECEDEDTQAVVIDGVVRCQKCDALSNGIRTCARCGTARLELWDPIDEGAHEDDEDHECMWCEPD